MFGFFLWFAEILLKHANECYEWATDFPIDRTGRDQECANNHIPYIFSVLDRASLANVLPVQRENVLGHTLASVQQHVKASKPVDE